MDAGDVWASVEFPMREATQEQPLPERGHGSGGRGADAQRSSGSRRGEAPEPLDYADPAVRGRCAGADAPGRSRDRLARRRYGDGAAQDPRGRRRSRRARRRCCGDRVLSLRRAPRRPRFAGAAPGRRRRAARRRRPPRDGRRRSVDHAPQSVGAASRARSSCLRRWCWGIGSPMCPKSPLAPEATVEGRDVAADPLRGARRRRLAALRLLQRRDGDRPVRAAARRIPRTRRRARREPSS